MGFNFEKSWSFTGFPHSSVGKQSACNAGDPSLIPGLGRSTGEGLGYPLQYSWASFVAQLVKICPQCGRPGFYPWVGKIPWKRERLPTLVFWPGEFHGLSPWGRKELDTTEWLSLHYLTDPMGIFTDEMMYLLFTDLLQNKGDRVQGNELWGKVHRNTDIRRSDGYKGIHLLYTLVLYIFENFPQ